MKMMRRRDGGGGCRVMSMIALGVDVVSHRLKTTKREVVVDLPESMVGGGEARRGAKGVGNENKGHGVQRVWEMGIRGLGAEVRRVWEMGNGKWEMGI